MLLSSLAFAREQIIIKLENPQKFELIDLKQVKSNDINDDEPIFDSFVELLKNNVYLNYEDTKKDFVLLVAYDDNISLEYKENFLSLLFDNFTQKVLANKSLELLNKQNNYLYQHPINFNNISKDKKYEIFDVSKFLIHEPQLDRTFIKIPEYLLFIAFDEVVQENEKLLFLSFKKLKIKLRYKILDTKKKIILKDEYLILSLDFDKNAKNMAQNAAYELESFFAKLASKL